MPKVLWCKDIILKVANGGPKFLNTSQINNISEQDALSPDHALGLFFVVNYIYHF